MPNSDGVFTVHSAWSLIRQPQVQIASRKWTWNPSLPGRISIFMWRLLNNTLAFDNIVQRKGIQLCSKCVYCANGESPDHCLLYCHAANSVWNYFSRLLGIGQHGNGSLVLRLNFWWLQSGSSLFGHICALLPSLICWELWKARNHGRHEDHLLHPKHIIWKIKKDLMEASIVRPAPAPKTEDERMLADLLHLKHKSTRRLFYSVEKWTPSYSKPFIINTDGSCRANLNVAGGGGLIRNASSTFIGAFHTFYGNVSSVIAEGLALLDGIILATETSSFPLEIQMDSLLLVQCINGGINIPWNLYYICKKIQLLLEGKEYCVLHVFRERNGAADSLAQIASSLATSAKYHSLGDLPDMTKQALIKDSSPYTSFRFHFS